MLGTYYVPNPVLDIEVTNMSKTFFLLNLWLMGEVDNLPDNYSTAANYNSAMDKQCGAQRRGSSLDEDG